MCQTEILTIIVSLEVCPQRLLQTKYNWGTTNPTMSDTKTEEVAHAIPELKSNSRLVVLLGSPDGIKDQSKKLSRYVDVLKVRRGVFIISAPSSMYESEIQTMKHISFIKTREIPGSRARTNEVHFKRVYSLVAFSLKNPNAKQKKRIERLVKKSIGIRIRPGVILFPLFRSKDQRRMMDSDVEKPLIDSIKFKQRVSEIGANTYRWSRLRLVKEEESDIITEFLDQNVTKDLLAIETKFQTLRELTRNPEISTKQLKRNYTILSGRFKEIKLKWMSARKLWSYDAEKRLKRTYNQMISTRRGIVERS